MFRNPLLAVLLIALGVRVATVFALDSALERRGEKFLFGDSEGYWILAEQIRDGEPYQFGAPEASVVRMPGFPLLLAGVFVVLGNHVLAVRLVMAVLGTLAVGLVGLLGRRLFDPRVGFGAAAVAAVYPSFALFSAVVLSETFFVVFMLANLVLLARVLAVPRQRPQPARSGHDFWRMNSEALLCGLFAGTATLVRPSWMLFSPAVMGIQVALGPRRETALRQAVLLLLGMTATLAPWWVRNYRVTGRFVPTTLWVGASLYDGLNPNATGASDMRFLDEVKAKRLGEYEQDRYLRSKAIDFARQHPRRVLELAVVKFLRYWSPWPHAEPFQNWLAGLVLLLSYGPVMVLAVAGFWRHRRRGWTVVLLALPLLYFCLIHVVFVSSIRYRLPGMYPAVVLAAAALVPRPKTPQSGERQRPDKNDS